MLHLGLQHGWQLLIYLGYPPLHFPKLGAESEVEQSGDKEVPTRVAGITADSFSCYTTLAPQQYFYKMLRAGYLSTKIFGTTSIPDSIFSRFLDYSHIQNKIP